MLDHQSFQYIYYFVNTDWEIFRLVGPYKHNLQYLVTDKKKIEIIETRVSKNHLNLKA
jgi:hypothetical protein